MAIVVSITKVKIAITAGGSPMPRKPLMTPAKKKAPKTINVIQILGEGKSVSEMNSLNIALPQAPLLPVRFDARALYTPVARVIAPANINNAHIGRDR